MQLHTTYVTEVQAPVASVSLTLEANEVSLLVAEASTGQHGPHTQAVIDALSVALKGSKTIQVPA